MMTTYVFRVMQRHRGRTAIMVVALAFVSTMLVLLNNTIATARRQMVGLAAQNAGAHDIVVARTETSPEPLVEVERLAHLFTQAHPSVQGVHGRFQATVEIARGVSSSHATLLARDPARDRLGSVQMEEGEYNLEGDNVVLLRDAADTYGLKVGDKVCLNYLVPEARQVGQERAQNASVRRLSHCFTVAGIATQSGLGAGIERGILAHLETVQRWLNVPGWAGQLVIQLDGSVYDALGSRSSAQQVRRIAELLRAALGEEAAQYTFAIPKAEALVGSDNAFSTMLTITLVYGFLSMGVVGLLVYALVNANVDDRRRDLAFMRVIGARRKTLLALVLIEVFLVGAMGVGLGLVIGQAISTLLVDRMIGALLPTILGGAGLDRLPVMEPVRLALSPWSLFSTALIASLVLLASALAPAIKASTTKIRYAVDPDSADSLQIEDLARLRERRFNWKITIAGLTLTMMWSLLFVSQLLSTIGQNDSLAAAFVFGGMILMVLGISLLFFALTLPFERLILALFGLIVPRLAFFSDKNVRRAKRRNTTIALMIVFSATLPTFLGTTAALNSANAASFTRQINGAPIVGRVGGGGLKYLIAFFFHSEQPDMLRPAMLSEFASVPGVGSVVGLTQSYLAQARNLVKLEEAQLEIQAWTRSPLDILYSDLTQMVGDGEAAFRRMFHEPDTILLSASVAEILDVEVGDRIVVDGEGIDHQVELEVVGIVERMAGFPGMAGRQNRLWGSHPAFVSLDTYLRLTHDPAQQTLCPGGVCSAEERDAPVIGSVFADMEPGIPASSVADRLRSALSDWNNLQIELTDEQIQREQETLSSMRLVLLVLTTLSLVTSVFGVFSVIYVTVHTRHAEIGVLKAIGITGRQLVGTLAIESLTMTISTTLAGATAGTVLGYVFYASENVQRNTPTRAVLDLLTVGLVLAMVIAASLVSAAVASRGIVRQRVTEILRK